MRASLPSTTVSCVALASSGRQPSLLESSSTRASIRASRGASSVGLACRPLRPSGSCRDCVRGR
eukprot:scaffold102031_cov67-Phaeocystis_antarctica.AAC.3